MAEKIRGSWPGGPKRDGEPPPRTRPPQLQRVEDIEARIAGRALRMRRRSRTKRVWIGLTFSLLLAGGFGWVLGLQSHTTLADVTASQSVTRQQDADISSEINRVMLELWRMEDIEFQRNRSGR